MSACGRGCPALCESCVIMCGSSGNILPTYFHIFPFFLPCLPPSPPTLTSLSPPTLTSLSPHPPQRFPLYATIQGVNSPLLYSPTIFGQSMLPWRPAPAAKSNSKNRREGGREGGGRGEGGGREGGRVLYPSSSMVWGVSSLVVSLRRRVAAALLVVWPLHSCLCPPPPPAPPGVPPQGQSGLADRHTPPTAGSCLAC